jgi:YibE/F-like protein
VLNDVTITQASAVWELADSGDRERQSKRHLFSRAMRIGRDHIASTVYTIAFATAGASLSVLLLIAVYNRPLLQVLQTEQFAGEVIRTLVGSIGLVLAVPLTTAVGVAVVRASDRGRRPAPAGDPGPEQVAAAPPSTSPTAPGTAAAPGDAPAEPAREPVPAGPAKDSEAATEARWRRWRRQKPVDDFGFSDLRDPDEKGTGTSGRPTR